MIKKKKTTLENNNVSTDKDCSDKCVAAKYERVPLWCKIAIGLLAFCGILYLAFCLSADLADFFNTYVSQAFRFVFAKLTNLFPFSVAEASILLMPVILVLTIRYFAVKRCKTPKQTAVSLVCILSAASMLLSGFVLTFAAGYRGNTLDKKLELDREKLSAEELYNAADYVVGKVNELAAKIEFDEDGFSVMPYDRSEMNKKLLDAYASYADKHQFIGHFKSRVKPVLLSEVMSYAHITGVYTFFTGESNINKNFPDYTIPYTAAHELAHQRGIAREDEANMIAFLVSLESNDQYIRYCAYVNMYEYLISALSRADKTMARKVRAKLDKKVYAEQLAYNEFFKKYEKSVTSQVSGAVNDAYLKGQGTEGEKSYGMVVDLTVAYLKKQQLVP